MTAPATHDGVRRVLRDTTVQPRSRLLARVVVAAASPVVQLLPLTHHDRSDGASRTAELEQLREAARAEGFQEGLASATESDRRAGYEAGFDEGVEKGRAAGESAIEQRLALIETESTARAERFAALLAAFEAQLDERLRVRLRGAEDDMVALSHAAICRILGEQAIPGATTRAAVSQAITRWLEGHSGSQRSWTIHVHPRDLERLRSDTSLNGMLLGHARRDVTWQADPQLTMGGCVISGDEGRLDARLDTQLLALAEVLREDAGAELPGAVAA